MERLKRKETKLGIERTNLQEGKVTFDVRRGRKPIQE